MVDDRERLSESILPAPLEAWLPISLEPTEGNGFPAR
jgi:hypothetical protein